MQTVLSDQHVWKYFLKTRKTRITLNLEFPFESGSIQSIGLSISKLLTEQPFKPFISWWRSRKDLGRKYLRYFLEYHILIKAPAKKKTYKFNPPFAQIRPLCGNHFSPKMRKFLTRSVQKAFGRSIDYLKSLWENSLNQHFVSKYRFQVRSGDAVDIFFSQRGRQPFWPKAPNFIRIRPTCNRVQGKNFEVESRKSLNTTLPIAPRGGLSPYFCFVMVYEKWRLTDRWFKSLPFWRFSP